jgi:chaperone modulatory protein CbpM
MKRENLISIHQLCTHYQIELSFFNDLNACGLIELRTLENTHYIDQDKLNELEKMIRIHQELDINMEGIDVVFNLLKRIDELQAELISAKNRLNHFEKY